MKTNHNNNTHPFFTTSVNNNNLENMASAWPIIHPISSTSASSSSCGFLTSNMFGINLEREGEEEQEQEEQEEEELGAMKETMYRIAALQPVDIDPSTIREPKRRNVWISDDPQSVAARRRRERIREKIQILRKLVPGGTKLDTASMLDEAIRYVKFLKRQIRLLQSPPPPLPPTPQHCNNIGSTITTTANTSTTLSDWPCTPASTSTSASAAITRLGFNSSDDSSLWFYHKVISE